jgi:hypothetical protein
MSAAYVDVLMLMRLVTALSAAGLFISLAVALKRRSVKRRDLLAALAMAAHIFVYRLYVLLVLDLNVFGSLLMPREWAEMWATSAYLHGIITFWGYVALVIYRNKGEV